MLCNGAIRLGLAKREELDEVGSSLVNLEVAAILFQIVGRSTPVDGPVVVGTELELVGSQLDGRCLHSNRQPVPDQ